MEQWYVIQVHSGLEEKTKKFCKLLIDESILVDCFVPYFIKMKKVNNDWIKQKEVLFKGYIFLISNRVEELYQELKRVPEFTKLLGKQGNEIFPLSQNEIDFLKTYTNENKLIDLSTGYIEGEKVIITGGPLKGKEAMIRKIDRHKRIAYLNIDFFGKTTATKIGLEIITKNI